MVYSAGEIENVRVAVRLRPLSKKEKASGCVPVVLADSENAAVYVQNPNPEHVGPPKTFMFDLVFNSDSKQLDVYNEVARPIVDKVFDGYNGTIFAYGQTGTGKTFTMEGSHTSPELNGIIPNSFAHIFGHIAKAKGDIKFLVSVSYFEIYNEGVYDLLSKHVSTELDVKERPDIGVYVKDLSTYVVNNADDMHQLLMTGNKNRATASTAMNSESSRSHAIFSISIETSRPDARGEYHVKVGRLRLVDLAGSERQSKTGALGIRFKEATKINLSLSTLGNVISSLVDGKSTHIPYRNSKLTRILQDSLGGNSKTVMCATIGPAGFNYDETISTLRYANRAKNIQNTSKANEDPKEALLRQFQLEIEALKKQIDDSSKGLSEAEGEEDNAAEEEEGLVVGVSEKVTSAVQSKREELDAARQEMIRLKEKLENMEKKIIVGGENLLEKSVAQEKLLEDSAKELLDRKSRQMNLNMRLQEVQAEKMDTEDKYSGLQERSGALTKKLKKLSAAILAVKEDLKDTEDERKREIVELKEISKQTTKELKMQEVIIEHFVPDEYLDLIKKNSFWNEEIGEWELRCVAYTGNNMAKELPNEDTIFESHRPDFSHVYLTYKDRGLSTRSKSRTGKRT
ncbi:kinesin-II 85 kDa subunit [Adelges cooleyi]|uniref:kinesin-II 85 kDa subunit n=1 Tax=Adelges cooleyi TaxID=133065 RepID=UPI00217F3532|nr:kinesin-II 85 kDa subunit [Adelges cooleyi]